MSSVYASCTYWCHYKDHTVTIADGTQLNFGDPMALGTQLCIHNDVTNTGYKAGIWKWDQNPGNVLGPTSRQVQCNIYDKYGCSTPCVIPNFGNAAVANGSPGNPVIGVFNPTLHEGCAPPGE